MNQKTWPNTHAASLYTALSFSDKTHVDEPHKNRPSKRVSTTRRWDLPPENPPPSSSQPSDHSRDYSTLPDDLIIKIAGTFNHPNLKTASLVCKAWRDALQPLREAMFFLSWGKKYKHGRGGVKVNQRKALNSCMKGAARGSTLAMVDAGLLYWDMGKKDKGMNLFKRAAELGDPAGQCNLGLSYLQTQPPNQKEAVKWLYKSAFSGYVRAQYQLALCLYHGRGINRNVCEAAKWYIKASEGGYVRSMYYTSLCYQWGEGVARNFRKAKRWMKQAADHGLSKAQFEHGLGLFAEGEMEKAAVYLELATRAGETAADRVKTALFLQMSAASRERVIQLADNWRALPAMR